MNKIIAGILAFLLIFFPDSGILLNQYQVMSFSWETTADKLVSAIKKRDLDALEAMMCHNIKENVDDLAGKIEELIDAIKSDIVRFTWETFGGYEGKRDVGKNIAQKGLEIILKTSEDSYCLNVIWEYSNSFQLEEKGIRNIGLLDSDDILLVSISATEGIGEWHDSISTLETETVTIGGAVYRNNFVGEGFHLLKEYNFYSAKPLYKEYHINYSVPYYSFGDDWVFRGKSSSWGDNTGENIYCREDKWEELRAYYANEENFNYYYRATDADGSVTIPAVDPEKFDALRVFSDDNAYGTGRNIAETRQITGAVAPFFTFYKESNDGLFFAKTLQFFVYEGELLFYRYYNGATGVMVASVLPDDLEQYFSSILDS